MLCKWSLEQNNDNKGSIHWICGGVNWSRMKTSSGLFSIISAPGELKVQSHICAEDWGWSFCPFWNHIRIGEEGEKHCYMFPWQLVLLILKTTLASLMPSIKCIHLAAERERKRKGCKTLQILSDVVAEFTSLKYSCPVSLPHRKYCVLMWELCTD